MLDLILRQAHIPDRHEPVDIGCEDGVIAAVHPQLKATANREIDVQGNLVTPPFVDSHFHLDAPLTYGLPRMNRSGTLCEGMEIWEELKPHLTVEAVKARAGLLLDWAIARGTLAIRSHVDICDPRLLAVEALLEVRQIYRPYIDLQLVAFPQNGYFGDQQTPELLIRSLEKGLDIIGGVPNLEPDPVQGAASVRHLCELAAKRGLMVDMHCDESDDPRSRYVENLAAETKRLGLQGLVTGSHLTSLHSMDNDTVSRLLPLIASARLNVVANPLVNIVLQGRQDNYPKRRGITRIKQLLDHGVNVSLGHDSVMDSCYPLGNYDMLEVAHMAVHGCQMTATAEMDQLFDAVTVSGAATLGLNGYGLEPGCYADMVVLQAGNPWEALRLKPPRLYVIRRGQVIAQTPALEAQLKLDQRRVCIDFKHGKHWE